MKSKCFIFFCLLSVMTLLFSSCSQNEYDEMGTGIGDTTGGGGKPDYKNMGIGDTTGGGGKPD